MKILPIGLAALVLQGNNMSYEEQLELQHIKTIILRMEGLFNLELPETDSASTRLAHIYNRLVESKYLLTQGLKGLGG